MVLLYIKAQRCCLYSAANGWDRMVTRNKYFNTLKRQHYFCSLNSEVLVLQFSPQLQFTSTTAETQPTQHEERVWNYHGTQRRVCFQTKPNKTKQKNRRLREAAVSQCRAGTGEGEAIQGREAELGQRGRSQRRQYPQLFACQMLVLLH